MVGPGLTHRDAHHAIHEAAFAEAEKLTRLLRHTAQSGDHERALHLAGVLIEHWQTRTLRHAEVEEQGWYRDLAREHPERRADITQLTRDHDLLRRLLVEIEQILAARGWTTGIVERFEAMLLLNAIHSRDEEQRLLGQDAHERAMPAMPAADAASARDAPALATSAAPLAVTHPELYRDGIGHLAAYGIHPGDVQLSAWDTSAEEGPGKPRKWLRAAFGHDFAEVLDVPFPDPSDPGAVAQAFASIATTSERTIRADYYAAMRMTEPGAPGSGGKRGRLDLKVIHHSTGGHDEHDQR